MSDPVAQHGVATWARRGALVILAVLAAACAIWLYRPAASPTPAATVSEAPLFSDDAPSSPDPRLAYPTRYRNVRPEVRYVGDEACARCHARLAESYRRHPMGRSLTTAAEGAGAERLGPETHNPFEAFGFVYSVARQDGGLVQAAVCRDRQGIPFAEQRAEIKYVLGSGSHGRSYLVERDGYLFQSPIGWYTQAGRWDLQPTVGNPFTQFDHFARPVVAECIACHANRVEPVEHTTNRYRAPLFQGHAIGCERCHGPGELHVRRHESGEAAGPDDDTIVHPGKLDPALREAVCEQCHLQGEVRIPRRGRQVFDYRPGLPLEQFRAVFVAAPEIRDANRSVGQTEQMYASRCYRESRGTLGCTSCHDPHFRPAPEERAAYYRERCLHCHADRGCALPAAQRLAQSPRDNCTDCHMPQGGSSNVPHTANTDHRVIRRPGDSPPWVDPPPRLMAGVPLLLFHRQRAERPDAELERDLAVALVRLVETGAVGKQAHVEETVLSLLERSLTPDDLLGWRARGYALWLQGSREEALRAFVSILARVPDEETTLALAGHLLGEMRRWPEAAEHWRRAVDVNPYAPRYRFECARALAESGDWDRVLATCRIALELNPAHLGTRQLLVEAARHKGDSALAVREFELLRRCVPPEQHEQLRAWFHQPR